jgi:hypothetical protein
MSKFFTRHQVGFIACGDSAGDDRKVLSGADGDAAAGLDVGRDLADVVFLDRQLFALGQRVFFVCRRTDGDVLACGDGDVAFGVDLAGDGVDVTACLHRQVASGVKGQVSPALQHAADVVDVSTCGDTQVASDLADDLVTSQVRAGSCRISTAFEVKGVDRVQVGFCCLAASRSRLPLPGFTLA